MISRVEENRQKVVKFVQELLRSEPDLAAITPALIDSKIDLVLTIKAEWGEGLDRLAVTDELIRRFSLWMGTDTTLTSNEGHVAWLVAGRKEGWRYWHRYGEWLERRLSFKAVDALDRSTDKVLGLLEDPAREGSWDRRGLVVGHVQSGKTGHYTGLINKAADAGYKIIIVLAGMHNNLRSQTQIRLDEGFLGYETKSPGESLTLIGVGEIDADLAIKPNYATTRADNGDFNSAAARNLGITPEQRPWLFVVKKNKTVLERLLAWIRSHVADSRDELGRKVVTALPLLMIDDEADNASVDTGEQAFDVDGNPDPEHDPKPINSAIRKILVSFTQRAYVAYTATPFANIFIHNRGVTDEEGPDLFPSAFISNLAAPSDYIGPARVFGFAGPQGREGGLPLNRPIRDAFSEDGRTGWMPPRHKNGSMPMYEGTSTIPPSLAEAVDSFILANAVRRLRGQEHQHSSMLVHVTRYTSVQNEVRRQVDEHVLMLRQRIGRRIVHEGDIARLRNLYETDFLPTTETVRAAQPDWITEVDFGWSDIEAVLASTLADIEVRTINGTAKDALDYLDSAATGLKVIAIGGDKLSRGLTLEGLCVSYFLRASRMYDTLMQMGRWFGYRPGYVDLCRMYMPSELEDWFGHITDSAEELREEFDMMAEAGATPDEYGLKVASHPVLMVTSPLKMRAARTLMLSFSGQILETVSLFRTRSELDRNLEATRRFLEAIGRSPQPIPAQSRSEQRVDRWHGHIWEDVGAEKVATFLGDYLTHPAARKVIGPLISRFIRSMAAGGELTTWSVALVGVGNGEPREILPGVSVVMNERKGDADRTDRYSIGRLLDPKDEGIGLDLKAWEAALEFTRIARNPDPGRNQALEAPEVPSGPAMRHVRGFGAPGVEPRPDRGLLVLYILDPKKAKIDLPSGTPPIVAFAASFPKSNSQKTVPYEANSVLVKQWEIEYGLGS